MRGGAAPRCRALGEDAPVTRDEGDPRGRRRIVIAGVVLGEVDERAPVDAVDGVRVREEVARIGVGDQLE